jgi:hypothetical protein
LKEPVIVDNKPGAATLVGAEFVAKQPPDGYTLLMATSTTLGISPALYKPSPINPVKDFAPIAQVGSVDFFLIANPAFPAKTVREMIDVIKRAPGKYNYASVGSGSPHHLFMEALKTEFGLEIQHVPYKGTPAALTDVLTGQVQLDVCRRDHRGSEHPGGQGRGTRDLRGEADDVAAGGPARRPRTVPGSTGWPGRESSRRPARRTRSSIGLPPKCRGSRPCPISGSNSTVSAWSLRRRTRPPNSRRSSRRISRAGRKAVKDSGAKVD